MENLRFFEGAVDVNLIASGQWSEVAWVWWVS